jgi:hypothetical protein
MKLGMRSPHVIPDVQTKWHFQIILSLAVVPFLSSVMFDF